MNTQVEGDFDRVYREQLERLTVLRRKALEGMPAEPMCWLAIAPAWTLELANAAGFPATDAQTFFEAATTAGFCTKHEVFPNQVVDAKAGGLFDLGEPQAIYSTPPARAHEIIEAKTGADWLAKLPEQIASVGRSVLQAAAKGAALYPVVRDWAELAARANLDAPRFLLSSVEQALENLDFAAAARWIEAAAPLERLIDGTSGNITESVYLAGLRYRLRERQNEAKKSLQHFVVRPEQLEAFDQLLRAPDTEWALHYAGVGGMGKTMLLRYLQAEEIPHRHGSAAHIDFDYLNPEYPSTKPALLLLQFAEELRLYDTDGVTSDYFDSLSRKALTFHESLTADSGPKAPMLLVQDMDFQFLLDDFAKGAHSLPQPLVLILDTCEELSKMQSDGSVPENVTATFAILEGLHARIPTMRVVFSGRRPLSSSGAGGWKSIAPVAGTRERSYLRLHEVRGFARATAEAFLKREANCPAHLVGDILTRCPERAYIPQFVWAQPDWNKPPRERFSPYDLGIYASWLATVPNLNKDMIGATDFTQYVKVRIIDRLRGDSIQNVLPALSWLGRFDNATVLALSGLPSGSEAANLLLTEILRQEWIERQAGTFLEIERGLRPLLFEYYRKNDPVRLEKARLTCVSYLQTHTQSARLQELDLSHFEALLRMLQSDPERAAEWWQRIENRVLQAEEYAFILSITRRLLAPELWPESSTFPGKRIAAAIAATHAAAEIHQGLSPEVSGTWEIVRREAEKHPIPTAVRRLMTLATVAALQFDMIQLNELDEQCLSALVRVLERQTSTYGQPLRTAERSLVGTWAASQELVWSDNSSNELRVFCALFLARAAAQSGAYELARRGYLRAFLKQELLSGKRGRWLFWKSPDDSLSRLKLEFLRGTCPSLFAPRELRWLLDVSWHPTNVDADRLASATLGLHAADRPVDLKMLNVALENSERQALEFVPVTDTHFIFPPFLVMAAEEVARAGRVGRALEKLLAISRVSEGSATSYSALADADRACARTLWRFRLLEEGYYIPDSILKSDRPEDVRLRFTLTAFEGREREANLLAVTSTDDLERSHSLWRSTLKTDVPDFDRELLDALKKLKSSDIRYLNSGSFCSLSFELDIVEMLQTAGLPLENHNRLIPSTRDIHIWCRSNLFEPISAFTLWVRCYALLGGSKPPTRLLEQIGYRCAGNIALDEGELLSLRLPDKALSLLRLASSYFDICTDPVGAALTRAHQALLYTQLSDFRRLEAVLRSLRRVMIRGASLNDSPAEPGRSDESFPFVSVQTWELAEGLVYGTRQAPQNWTRPWIFRIAACLAFAHDHAVSTTRQDIVLKQWYSSGKGLPREVLGRLQFNTQPDMTGLNRPPVATDTATNSETDPTRPVQYRLRCSRARASGTLFESAKIEFEGEDGQRISLSTPSGDTPYEQLSNAMRGHLPFDSRRTAVLRVDRWSAWICWESFFVMMDHEMSIRRTYERARGPSSSPSLLTPQLYVLTSDATGPDLVASAVSQHPGEQVIEWTYERSPERLTNRVPPKREGQILYIIGEPLETRAGLRIGLGRSDSPTEERGRLVSPDEASRSLPDIRLAILQCPSSRRSIRTGADRERAGYLRSFAAELHMQVPLVVTLPTLEFSTCVEILACFTNIIMRPISLAAAVDNGVLEARRVLRRLGPAYAEQRCDISFYGDEL